MKIKHIRCGICHDWFSANNGKGHCHSCGAVRVVISKKVEWYNRQSLRQMVRGFYAPLHEVIYQNWSQSIEER